MFAGALRGGLSHYWDPVSGTMGTVSRSRCGAIESLTNSITDREEVRCKACLNQEAGVLCAVPLRNLEPLTAWLIEFGKGHGAVGVLERLAASGGYAVVIYCELGGRGKQRSFVNREGEQVEFVEGGFRRSEWSAGTLVRPLMEDAMVSEGTLNALVEDGPAPKPAEIQKKVAQLKAKAAVKAAAKAAGNSKTAKAPAAKAPVAKVKAEKEKNPCYCTCGGETGGRFVPGHDARYFGWLKRIVAGKMEFSELPKAVQKRLVDVKGVKKELAASAH